MKAWGIGLLQLVLEVVSTLRKPKSFVRGFYSKHPEMVRSAGVSLILMGAGFSLLYLGVSVCDWNAMATNAGVGIIMNPVGFLAQRRYGFRSLDTLKRESAPLWALKSGITSGTSMVSFSVLVGVYGFPYESVRLILNFTLGPLSYFINKLLIFRGHKPLSRLVGKAWRLMKQWKTETA